MKKFKSMLHIICLTVIFCLSQILPVVNFYEPNHNVYVTRIQSNKSGLQRTTQESIQKVIPVCVLVEVRGQYDENYQPIKWYGSGVIVSENGVIVTAGHIVKDAVDIRVTLNDGREYKAIDFEYESTTDLGIIKIDANDLSIAPIGRMDNKVLGGLVFTVGSPFGKMFFNTVTVGVISGLKRDIPFFGEKLILQIDAATAPGKSGGGVFDFRGNLIGIMVGIKRGYEDINLCIPVNIVRHVLNKYCAKENLENVE